MEFPRGGASKTPEGGRADGANSLGLRKEKPQEACILVNLVVLGAEPDPRGALHTYNIPISYIYIYTYFCNTFLSRMVSYCPIASTNYLI